MKNYLKHWKFPIFNTELSKPKSELLNIADINIASSSKAGCPFKKLVEEERKLMFDCEGGDAESLLSTMSSKRKPSRASTKPSTVASEANEEFFQKAYNQFLPKLMNSSKNNSSAEFSAFFSSFDNLLSKAI